MPKCVYTAILVVGVENLKLSFQNINFVPFFVTIHMLTIIVQINFCQIIFNLANLNSYKVTIKVLYGLTKIIISYHFMRTNQFNLKT